MNNYEVDRLINNFNSEVDKGLEMQHDINIFAEQLADRMMSEIDKEGIIANFYDVNFSFKVQTKPNNWNKLIFAVRMLDLDNYRYCMRMSIPEQCKIKRAEFEHDGTNNLKDEIAKCFILLLFDHFGFEMNLAEEQGEEETVHIKA